MNYIFPGKDKQSVSLSNMLNKIKGFVVRSSFKFNRDTIHHALKKIYFVVVLMQPILDTPHYFEKGIIKSLVQVIVFLQGGTPKR